MIGKFTFLGTSGSSGVPVIGCHCSVCLSSDPLNQRLRPSGLLQLGKKNILIDVGPDFRQQCLKYKITHLDGVILTHTHYDHIAGIDELRIFFVRTKEPFPCLLSKESLEELKLRYYYLFQERKEHSTTLSAQLKWRVLEQEQGSVEFLGIPIQYVSYAQGGMKVNGFRIGDFAYISDIKDYDPSIFTILKGVKKLVLSALREKPSPIHFSLTDAVTFANQVGAVETRLTHVSHSVDHKQVNELLPPSVQLGYDGLEIEFEWNLKK